MNKGEFDRLWEQRFEYSPETTPADSTMCPYATQLQAWVDAAIQEVLDSPSLAGLNRSKVLLLDKFFEWRRAAPDGHRGVVTSGRGHTCLFQVLERVYEAIHQAELRLDPPPLTLPSQQVVALPPPPPPQIQGIFLGEEE